MNLRRAALVVLAASAVAIGAWATIVPTSFYEDFVLGRNWVSADGPYNGHLVRDVGGLNLALAVVTIAALWKFDVWTIRIAGIATVAYALPHTWYHLRHLEPFGTNDAVAIGVLVTAQLVLGAWLALAPGRQGRRRPA